MRKHYIDNLRNMTILLLFPVHTFMIWNDFGSGFYIWQKDSRLLSTLIVLVNPWFMPLLFVLAGISARYALKKRTYKEFVMQRVRKLLIPFVVGTILLNSFLTLYARKYFYNYKGSITDNLKYFFTHITDLSGYDGAFTPGHLWFILFLFIIAMVSLLIFSLIPYEKMSAVMDRIPAWGILCLFIPVWLMYYLGNFGGYSIGKSLALYLIGYYVLSNDSVMALLEKNIKWLAGLCVAGTITLVILYYKFAYYGDLWVNFIGWNKIVVLLVFGKKYLDWHARFTEYFNRTSYLIYILHQPVLVVLAYYVVAACGNMAMQVILICCGSFLMTVLLSSVYNAAARCIFK